MPSTTPASTSNAGSARPNNIPQHASSSNLDNSHPEHGLRFVANHHRQHNPHDPKLRATPVFKSRRSSLLGSVLKSKPRSSARVSAAASPHLRSLSAQSHHHHQHSQSLPTSIRPTRLDSDGRRHTSLLTSSSQVQHPLVAHSSPDAAGPSQTRPPDLHLADSPPVASLPSPVDQPDGSASTCSSTNAKDLDLATHACSQGSPPLVDVVDASSMSVPAARPSSTNLDRESQAGASLSHLSTPFAATPSPIRPCSSSREHGLTPSSSSNVAAPSASAALATHPSPLPVITHTDFAAADDALRGASPVAQTTAQDKARMLLSSCSPSGSDPSAPANDISVLAESSRPSVQTIYDSTSLAVTSPQRFSSLGRGHTSNTSKPSLAPISTTVPRARARARDINDELESPTSRETVGARAERRMSMLDFLAAPSESDASPRLPQASVSAEDLPRSAQLEKPASAVARPSMPLMQASRQLRLEAAAARSRMLQPKRIDLCSNIRLAVEPLVDRLTMFGSMQSGSNYSLAGTVVVEVPKLIVPRLSSAAAVARDGDTTDQPSVHVEELTVRFTGYSVYVDATGRFNAIKVTESSQQLLQPQGFSCPVQIVETGDRTASLGATASCAEQEALKYETEFDLSIPGWLPASQRSRFGATFYCVQAIAIVQGQAVLSAVSGFDDDAGDDPFGQYSLVHMARSLESEVADTGHSATNDGAPSPTTTLGRTKTKKTWLNKTAKQLQLRTARKSTGPEAESGSHSNSRRGSGTKDVLPILDAEDPLFSKTTEAGNQCLPDGRHSIKSECLSILVRRCRDVVPVPVARLVRLATASQVLRDTVEQPSLSQSMAALARLQDSLDLASESTPPQLRSDAGRPHMTPSASAPALSQTTSPSSDPASGPPAGATAPAALAPSPRIDTHPNTLASDPLRADDAQSEPGMIMPRAPSAFDSPRDPAKLAAVASALTASATLPTLPSSMSRASSLLDSRFGNANSPPRTSSRAVPTSRSSAPLRHFVHRPTLHLPPQLGIAPDSSSGLTFSLTLSLPSHVHVSGPKSDVLSFGVQIEVGRTEGWDALRKWGGLRLKDMELVCLQTERHSSMPSRSFCATFPVPPQPNNVDAADLPVVTGAKKRRSDPAGTTDAQVAAERRLRQSYDRSLLLGHIALANQGKAPHPIENNVERIRTTIVGPPPFTPKRRGHEGSEAADASRKGKYRAGSNFVESARSASRPSPAGSGANTPDGTSQSAGISSLRAAFAPAAQVTAGSRSSVMQPLPRALTRSTSSSSSSLRQAFNGSHGSATRQSSSPPAGPADGSSPTAPAGRSRRPIPFDIGAAAAEEASRHGLSQELSSGTASSAEAAASQTGAPALRDTVHRADSDAQMPDSQRGDVLVGVSSSVSTGGGARTARGPRRSRFETAMSRLSTFASSMLEQPSETSAAGSNAEVRGSTSANATTSGTGTAAAASLRATYAFSGDDAEGVDLTKGRVRMTINLPLVASDVEAARKAGSAQLIPDFESPYVRVRHKLKVKLGFGLKSNVATGQDGEEWGQVLVMCVPVRFTEAPPKEVQDQFGPVTIGSATPSPTNNSRATRADGTESEAAAAAGAPQNGGALPVPFAEPLLPAYAQLFREDGSRLADEGEDLPRYPGRMSVIGEIDEESVPATNAQDSQEGGPETSAGALLDDEGVEGEAADVSGDKVSMAKTGGAGLPRSGTMTLPRTSSLGCMAASMDRATSLPGRQVLTRASSSSLFGLRSAPLQPSASGASQIVTLSPFSERSSSIAGSRARVGSSAFDPLPARPGMRRRSATTTSLITSSRIMPAEVLDEALVTSALDDEEDRMDELHPSRTLESLRGRDGSGMDGLAGDEDGEEDEDQVDVEEVEVVGADLHDEDGDDEFLDGVDSNGGDSEAGHTAMNMHHGQFSGSDDAEGDAVDAESSWHFAIRFFLTHHHLDFRCLHGRTCIMYIYDLPTTGTISFSDFLVTTDLVSQVSQTTQLRARLRAVLKENRAGTSSTAVKDGSSSSDIRSTSSGGGSKKGDDAFSSVGGASAAAAAGGNTSDWLTIVKTIEEYLPHMLAVFNCVQTDDLILRYEPVFSWRTSISGTRFRGPQRVDLSGLYYELASVLLTYALTLSNFAAATVASLGSFERDRSLSSDARKLKDDRLRWAADTLCRSAGILLYLSTDLLPKWSDQVGRVEGLPPDLTTEATLALSKVCLAEAQALAIRKLVSPSVGRAVDTVTPGPPLAKDHPSASLLAKLHLSVVEEMESAVGLLRTVGEKGKVKRGGGGREMGLSANHEHDLARRVSASRDRRDDDNEDAAVDGKGEGKKKFFSKFKIGKETQPKHSGPHDIHPSNLNSSTNHLDPDLDISSNLLRYLSFSTTLHRSMAYKWLAIDHGESSSHFGTAIAYLSLSSSLLSSAPLKDASLANIVSSSSSSLLKSKKTFVEQELATVDHWLGSYRKLNDTVAFQPVAGVEEVLAKVPMGRAALGVKRNVSEKSVFDRKCAQKLGNRRTM
ncbi:hypothetical protein PHSY_005614 [Pseudozyma hubeiensis SY62]|uniref:pH-response regulator protein palC n=1 Tax=Pseudozyma hubeiensis (strain SY62) TaxID=1305764 RepID=R9P9I1_PSEHS|nr:hypothetical protein PHSY_005614 [Pseudozyma hubeiensis SY62]GAC98026.1 hypothetical protein PHSY_005614 [Pseudozyma hubeiensis SY62]